MRRRTQAELADTLGLTAVHVNRMLQALRRKNFITLQGQRLVLRNVDEL
jgi:DNA-binding transcriptional regulator LsrR (DeoR family)